MSTIEFEKLEKLDKEIDDFKCKILHLADGINPSILIAGTRRAFLHGCQYCAENGIRKEAIINVVEASIIEIQEYLQELKKDIGN